MDQDAPFPQIRGVCHTDDAAIAVGAEGVDRMRVVVIGAGVAGLMSSLFLARDGHDVVLLERDATPLPEDAESAFNWDRRGATQVRHPHAFLGLLRNILRDDLPDVMADLRAAGAYDVKWMDFAPDTLGVVTPEPGDEDLAMIASRRTTFEWVLRKAALRTDRVELRDGVKVTGLMTAPDSSPPRVTGVRTESGDIDADLVVDAGGRHSAIRTLLSDIGVTFPEERHNTDMAYLSRFYRLLPGAELPDKNVFTGGTTGYLGYGIFRGDGDTFSVTIAIGTDDEELRTLIDGPRFDVAARLLPAGGPWLAEGVSEPIAPMHVMASTINRKRDLVVDGKPLVVGYQAIGDALVCTNPLYGRGCSLGSLQAKMLASALRDCGSDLQALALRMDEDAQREMVPWFSASVTQDEAARMARQSTPGDAVSGVASILTEGLLPLTRVDAHVARAFFRMLNLLAPPDTLFSDPEIMRRALEYWNARDTRPPEPLLGPPRHELIAALKAAAPDADAVAAGSAAT
jgi:2-polyprenyl-6-methoxyphenol hydroxylase-like FAD-dependent oxidoreductase